MFILALLVGGMTLTRLAGGCPCVLLAPLVVADLLLDLSSLSSSLRNSRFGYGMGPPSNTLEILSLIMIWMQLSIVDDHGWNNSFLVRNLSYQQQTKKQT